jgi:hypothetical protein
MNTSITTNLAQLCNTPVELGRNFLKIPDGATDEQLKTVGAGLLEISGSNMFWVGDYLLAIETRKGEHYAKQYEALHYAPNTMHGAKYVCRRLPPHLRLSLSFSHHREALVETKGNADLALHYLAQAKDSSLTVSQMRKAIRLDLNPPAEKDGSKLIADEKQEFLLVMDAIATINRFLLKTDSKTVGLIKGYIFSELETLYETAKAVN